MELIDKDIVVAEIERRMKKFSTINFGHSVELDALYGAKCKALMEILSFLNTLETKEVDLNDAVEDYIEQHKSELNGYMDIRRIARHFYVLGLKAQKGE